MGFVPGSPTARRSTGSAAARTCSSRSQARARASSEAVRSSRSTSSFQEPRQPFAGGCIESAQTPTSIGPSEARTATRSVAASSRSGGVQNRHTPITIGSAASGRYRSGSQRIPARRSTFSCRRVVKNNSV